MSGGTRWKIYALLGCSGLALGLYVFCMVLSLDSSTEHYRTSFWISSATGVVIVLAGLLNFYTAFGFKFGKIDAVVGSRRSAVLIRGENNVRDEVRIRAVRYLDSDQLDLTDDQRLIFFIGNWRPWVCPVSGFRCV
jgi:hypothetical protein